MIVRKHGASELQDAPSSRGTRVMSLDCSSNLLWPHVVTHDSLSSLLNYTRQNDTGSLGRYMDIFLIKLSRSGIEVKKEEVRWNCSLFASSFASLNRDVDLATRQ